MDHKGAIAYIISKLKKELKTDLTYHSLEHTLQVMKASEEIALECFVDKYDLDLLLTAAAFHDTGFTEVYHGHEEKGCEIARKVLPEFNYKEKEVEQICSMIMATKIPQSPSTLLEQIICDADLSYLAEDHYFERASDLYEEMICYGSSMSPDQWVLAQIKFLKNHKYHSDGTLQSRATQNKNEILKLLHAQMVKNE